MKSGLKVKYLFTYQFQQPFLAGCGSLPSLVFASSMPTQELIFVAAGSLHSSYEVERPHIGKGRSFRRGSPFTLILPSVLGRRRLVAGPSSIMIYEVANIERIISNNHDLCCC